jgi:transposase
MRRYALRDDQWDRIKDVLPGREGHVGVTAKDNRLFVEAVLYRYRAGMPWWDLPERFGDPIKIHTRFSRWAKSGVWNKSGVWKKIFEMLAADADNEYAMIDSTIVRAHQHSAGAQKKTVKTRRSGAAKTD